MAKKTVAELNDRSDYNPFVKWMGFRVLAAGEEELTFTIDFKEEMIGSPDTGYLHGGITAAVIDTACCFVIALQSGTYCPTLDLRIDYHRGSKPALGINGSAKIIKYGKTISVAEAYIHGDDGSILSSGRCTFFTGFKPAVAQ